MCNWSFSEFHDPVEVFRLSLSGAPGNHSIFFYALFLFFLMVTILVFSVVSSAWTVSLMV